MEIKVPLICVTAYSQTRVLQTSHRDVSSEHTRSSQGVLGSISVIGRFCNSSPVSSLLEHCSALPFCLWYLSFPWLFVLALSCNKLQLTGKHSLHRASFPTKHFCLEAKSVAGLGPHSLDSKVWLLLYADVHKHSLAQGILCIKWVPVDI